MTENETMTNKSDLAKQLYESAIHPMYYFLYYDDDGSRVYESKFTRTLKLMKAAGMDNGEIAACLEELYELPKKKGVAIDIDYVDVLEAIEWDEENYVRIFIAAHETSELAYWYLRGWDCVPDYLDQAKVRELLSRHFQVIDGQFVVYDGEILAAFTGDRIGCGEVRVPAEIRSIGETAFEGCGFESFTVPPTVKEIGGAAFHDCRNLKSVTFEQGLACIWADAFADCICLKSVEIPNSVTTIWGEAFAHCDSLERVTVGSGVVNMGEGVFIGCENVTSIEVASDNPVYHSAGNCVIKTADKVLVQGFPCSVIPADGSVTAIGEYAFFAFEMKSIELPGCIRSIAPRAFGQCYNLKDVYFKGSREDWEGMRVELHAKFPGEKSMSVTVHFADGSEDKIPVRVSSPV